MAYLDIKDLSFTYPDCPDKAIDGVSLSIERGEFVVLIVLGIPMCKLIEHNDGLRKLITQ